MQLKLSPHIWKQDSIGGVILLSSFLLILAIYFTCGALRQLIETNNLTDSISHQMQQTNAELDILNKHKKLCAQEKEYFTNFKKQNLSKKFNADLIKNEIRKIQTQTKVESLTINSFTILKQTEKVTHVKVKINLKTLRDYSFFSFLKKLENSISGNIKILNFNLKRSQKLTPQLIHKIKNAEKASLFEGTLDFEIFYEQHS